MPPSAAPTSIQEFCLLLNRSKLMDADSIKESVARWRQHAGGKADQLEGFRRFLIQQGKLTEYQAALLARGHSDGFFLDAYQIHDRLGKGRMAGAFKAVHPSGQVVAIRALVASRTKDANLLRRFQGEARQLAHLRHPNIVTLFDLGDMRGVHYIVMEYLEGETVAEALERRKRLPPPEAARIIHQTLLGLQQIHLQGLVHRNLKLANLMLVPVSDAPATGDTTLHATVKLLDIGLGRVMFDETIPGDQLTPDGTPLGSPEYLAPEHSHNASGADIRADIYSAGCMFYHLLTGRPPFEDKNVSSLAMRHAKEDPPPLSQFINEVPDGLQQVLNWMMAKDPAKRYPTPERAAQALQMFLHLIPDASPPQPPLVEPAYERVLQGQATPDKPDVPVGKLAGAKPKSRSRETAAAPAFSEGSEFDVELVPLPPPPSADDRSLAELNRRDVIMLAAGAGGVLVAILAGYGLSRLVKD